MTDYYLSASDNYPTPEEAWEHSEGAVWCEAHADPETLLDEYWFIPVPEGMTDPDNGELVGPQTGYCPECLYDYWDGMRRDSLSVAFARYDDYLRKRKSW